MTYPAKETQQDRHYRQIYEDLREERWASDSCSDCCLKLFKLVLTGRKGEKILSAGDLDNGSYGHWDWG